MSDEPKFAQIKFCRDCKWSKRPWLNPMASARCLQPLVAPESREYLVTGDPGMGTYCSVARIKPCGPEGKLWEPRV